MNFNKIILIINDSLGVGNDKDAKKFGDEGASTLSNINEKYKLKVPVWRSIGVGPISDIKEWNNDKFIGYSTRLSSVSNAKDTLSGHWEMMGFKTKHPFPTFWKNGFPKKLIDKISLACDNREIIGNCAASGTEILKKLWKSEKKNKLIIYTSHDSVLQVCGNEKTMSLKKLYKYCENIRKICSTKKKWDVGRVIARPYKVDNEKIVRTVNRKDWINKLPNKMLLEKIYNKKIKITTIGKIADIFQNKNIDNIIKSKSNIDGMNKLIKILKNTNHQEKEFIFINLVDFDMKFGHRRDPKGYANAINEFDKKLMEVKNYLKNDELLMISADHGNDPTFKGTDHTRELVPLTIYSKSFKNGKRLDDCIGFGTIGNIIADIFNLKKISTGQKNLINQIYKYEF